MKTCPYCAETIRVEAIKCRHCGSMLDSIRGPGESAANWTRVEEGRRIAGVCTGIAREMNAPGLVLPIRVFFIITTFLSGFGLVLYALLWILMPSGKRAVQKTGKVHSSASSRQTGTAVLHVPKEPVSRKSGVRTALIGLVLVAIGAVLVMSRLGIGWDWPHGFTHFNMPDMPFFPPFREFVMVPFPMLVIIAALVMFVVLVGVLRFFKVMLGCGLIAVGLLFLMVLIPFAPAVLNIPVLIMIGIPVLILSCR